MKLLYFRILQALKFNGFIYLEIGFTESVGIGDFQHITDLPYIPQNKMILLINAAQKTFVLETPLPLLEGPNHRKSDDPHHEFFWRPPRLECPNHGPQICAPTCFLGPNYCGPLIGLVGPNRVYDRYMRAKGLAVGPMAL